MRFGERREVSRARSSPRAKACGWLSPYRYMYVPGINGPCTTALSGSTRKKKIERESMCVCDNVRDDVRDSICDSGCSCESADKEEEMCQNGKAVTGTDTHKDKDPGEQQT